MAAVNLEQALAFRVEPATAADVACTLPGNAPLPLELLSVVHLNHVDFDGRLESGELVLATAAVEVARRVFGAALAAEFPIRQMVNPNEFGGDDDLMMAADNTSCFNARPIAGTDRWSRHSYGLAFDINPLENPYLAPGGWVPDGARRFVDRSLDEPGMHHETGPIVQAFLREGARWGREFNDFHHFDFDPEAVDFSSADLGRPGSAGR